MVTLNTSSKPFYGVVDSSKFRLTKNSSLFPTPFIIHGTFKPIGNETQLNYQIRPIWFGYLWIRFFPVFGLIFINLMLLRIKNVPMEIIVAVNVFIPLMFFLVIFITNRFKRKLEETLITELEIG
jgi:hypothetical protein